MANSEGKPVVTVGVVVRGAIHFYRQLPRSVGNPLNGDVRLLLDNVTPEQHALLKEWYALGPDNLTITIEAPAASIVEPTQAEDGDNFDGDKQYIFDTSS